MKGNYPKFIIVIIYIYVPLSFQGSLQAKKKKNNNHYFEMAKSLNTSCDYQSKAKLGMLRYLEIP